MPASSASDAIHPADEALSARARKPLLLSLAPIPLVLLGLQTAGWGVISFLSRGSSLGATSLAFTMAGGLLLAAAWGFWADRLWARSLLLTWSVAVSAIAFFAGARMGGVGGAVGSSLFPVMFTALLWAYLYESRSAGAYYARLEEEEAARDP